MNRWSYATDLQRALAEARERQRRWLSVVHASSPLSEQPPRNPDTEAERLARELADEALTQEARTWLDGRIRYEAKGRLMGALQLCSNEARRAVADYPAAAEMVRRACSSPAAPALEVERALDAFTALALAAEHLADDDYHDPRLGR